MHKPNFSRFEGTKISSWLAAVKKPVVVFFWRDNDSFCDEMRKVAEGFAARFQEEIIFIWMEIDNPTQTMAQEYLSVAQAPTVLLLEGNREIARFSSPSSEPAMELNFSRVLPSPQSTRSQPPPAAVYTY